LDYRKLLRSKGQIQQASFPQKTKNQDYHVEEGIADQIKQIIENVPQPLVIVDSQGEIVSANSHAEELIGVGWDVKTIDSHSYKAALNGGSGAPVHVNGADYKLKAVELASRNGDLQILFILHPIQSPQVVGFKRAQKYLEVLKTCLSWFYKQRLREKEFQVLRAMAIQVQKLEQIQDGSYKKPNRFSGMTAQLPEMQDLDRVLSDGPQ